MYCASCGAQLGESAQFCASCGAPVPVESTHAASPDPPTATPPRRGTLDSLRYLREPRVGVPVVVGSLILVIVVAAVISSFGPGAGGDSSPPFTGRIGGDMGHDSVGVALNGSQDAFNALHWDNVWCGWQGDHVFVHATFTNTFGASVIVHVTPAYDVVNGGTHGDSGDITAHVPAGQTVSWIGDAGKPQGVSAGAPLQHCGPSVSEVDLGVGPRSV
jgi:hypothetical protein